MKKKLMLIPVLLFVFSCKLNNAQIEKLEWKYSEGYYIGDVITFNEKTKLKNDTIFINDIPNASMIKSMKRIDGSESLKIKSLVNNKKGYYYAKW
jgi:hypothetical protein